MCVGSYLEKTLLGGCMHELLDWLFSSDNFLPHGHCFLWQPGTLWLNVGADGLIAFSYFMIPVALLYFFRQRRWQIPYGWIPLMFAAFILLCGATHVMEIWTIWNPLYREAGALKLVTGIVSFATLITLIYVMPHAMLLQTPRQLQSSGRHQNGGTRSAYCDSACGDCSSRSGGRTIARC